MRPLDLAPMSSLPVSVKSSRSSLPVRGRSLWATTIAASPSLVSTPVVVSQTTLGISCVGYLKRHITDFMNHDGLSASIVLSDEDNQLSEVTADRDYSPGDDVLIRYGEFSNATLMLDFGFTLPYNTHDDFVEYYREAASILQRRAREAASILQRRAREAASSRAVHKAPRARQNRTRKKGFGSFGSDFPTERRDS